ncbi:TIGR04282 family arsenosugar biosynthesis glycosyltransferase [Halomonas sp. PBN3]|uniref:TIGR04282 family arsenosugar biosynthesis glycosyltransferase n=1 Tax=Halomonas sp. PBN3 TaxID=1397528 RepID=UPI0003B8C727|nr:DUF2064 domain-containing protein [Halomonas sp. PBN3]ERS87638.1 hypothetical protein Q671_01540 [Halomonas sp. PBN3]
MPQTRQAAPGQDPGALDPALAEALTRALAETGHDRGVSALRAMADTGLAHHHVWLARHGIARRPQPEGDLGERMRQALTPGPAMVIGSDCPALTPALLQRCAAALATHDAVCLPAEDGGYALLGLHQAHPSLFTEIA